MALTTHTTPAQIMSSIGVILLLAAGAGSYFFLAPRLKVASQAQDLASAQLRAVQAETAQLTDDQVKLQTLKRSLAQQNIDINRIQQVLPQTEQLPSLYIQIESVLAATPGLVAPTYQLGTPVKGTIFGADIPISFSAGGSYPQLKDLLAKLEQNIRPISFSQISITTGGGVAKAGTPANSKAAVAAVTFTATGFVRAQSLSGAFVKSATTK